MGGGGRRRGGLFKSAEKWFLAERIHFRFPRVAELMPNTAVFRSASARLSFGCS